MMKLNHIPSTAKTITKSCHEAAHLPRNGDSEDFLGQDRYKNPNDITIYKYNKVRKKELSCETDRKTKGGNRSDRYSRSDIRFTLP